MLHVISFQFLLHHVEYLSVTGCYDGGVCVARFRPTHDNHETDPAFLSRKLYYLKLFCFEVDGPLLVSRTAYAFSQGVEKRPDGSGVTRGKYSTFVSVDDGLVTLSRVRGQEREKPGRHEYILLRTRKHVCMIKNISSSLNLIKHTTAQTQTKIICVVERQPCFNLCNMSLRKRKVVYNYVNRMNNLVSYTRSLVIS